MSEPESIDSKTSQTLAKEPRAGLSVWQVVQSTLAGAIGVQSNKNRENDFKHGNIWIYVISGIIFTLIFILSITGVVRIALA